MIVSSQRRKTGEGLFVFSVLEIESIETLYFTLLDRTMFGTNTNGDLILNEGLFRYCNRRIEYTERHFGMMYEAVFVQLAVGREHLIAIWKVTMIRGSGEQILDGNNLSLMLVLGNQPIRRGIQIKRSVLGNENGAVV